MPTLKLCTDCRTEKDTSLFSSAGQGGGRLRPQCKECTRKREVSRYEARRAAEVEIPSTRVCTGCDSEKPLNEDNFKRSIGRRYGFVTECKSCSNKRNAEWLKTDAGKALRDRHASKYTEKRAEYDRAYKKKNREKYNAYHRDWRQQNLDKRRAVDAAWARQNKAKRTAYRHMRRAAGEFSYAVVPDLKRMQNGKCAVCRGLLTRFAEVDHIHPVALGGTNERSNLQLLCRPCNRSKGAKHPVDFMQSRGYLL